MLRIFSRKLNRFRFLPCSSPAKERIFLLLPLRRGRLGGGLADNSVAINTPPQPSPSQGREQIGILTHLCEKTERVTSNHRTSRRKHIPDIVLDHRGDQFKSAIRSGLRKLQFAGKHRTDPKQIHRIPVNFWQTHFVCWTA